MSSSRNLRWAGAGISNGRQRLSRLPVSSRQFSLRTSSKHTSRPTLLLASTNRLHHGQARSLSLFGWGASAKSSGVDGASSASGSSNIELGASSISNLRTVKASHATSDFPNPSQVIDTSGDAVSAPIERLSDAFALPADTSTFEEAQNDLVQTAVVPEHVGYLRDVCGLDFGWGFSTSMQWLFETIHISGGYGWVGSIIVLASLTRLTMVPAMIMAQAESQKIKKVTPLLAPLREQYQAAVQSSNRAKQIEVGGEMRALNKQFNIKYWKMFVPLLIQLPFQFGAFRMLRSAGDLPVPGFVDLPWLWNADLSLADPYYLTPLISSALIYQQFTQAQKQNISTAASPAAPQLTKLLGRIMPAASFMFMIWQPGAVQLYFLTSSAWAVATTSLLRQTPFRRAVGLDPLVPVAADPIASPDVKKKVPGGMQSARPQIINATARTVPEEPVSTPSQSFVEKGVDKFKSSVDGIKSTFSTATKSAEVKIQQKKSQADKQRQASFEDARERQLEIEREERNQRRSK